MLEVDTEERIPWTPNPERGRPSWLLTFPDEPAIGLLKELLWEENILGNDNVGWTDGRGGAVRKTNTAKSRLVVRPGMHF